MKKQPPVIKSSAPRIEIINLIDVLITLVAFSSLTMVLPENRGQLEIELPRAEEALPAAGVKEVVLELTDKHESSSSTASMKWGRNWPPLYGRLPQDTPLVIRADRSCRYQEIINLLDLCARNGLCTAWPWQ